MQRVFQKYDSTGEGSVPVSCLGKLAADLGQPMSNVEVADMKTILDPMDAQKVDFPEFYRFWMSSQ